MKLSTQNNSILLKNQTLLSDMTHKQSKTHTTTQFYTLMRSIQNNTTKTGNKCGTPQMFYSFNLMYCRVQYNTANNNKNNYSAPANPSLVWDRPKNLFNITGSIALARQRGKNPIACLMSLCHCSQAR